MKKNLLLSIALGLVFFRVHAQDSSRIFYVVDSIPILEDPAEGDSLGNNEVSDITVIKNKDSLKSLGHADVGELIYIFTKRYRNRSEADKRIPSSRSMEKKNGRFFLAGSDVAYSGSFIDYYLNGSKQGEGVFKDGLLDGVRYLYTHDGDTSLERHYEKGIPNGREKEYYPNGAVKQSGDFRNGKEEGVWQKYFPNGQVSQEVTFASGQATREARNYYSNGRLRSTQPIKNGRLEPDPSEQRLIKQYNKGVEAEKEENFRSAIGYYSKCLELDSGYVDAWFAKGTAELNDLQFDAALKDLDKAIVLEPYYMEAIANRAFVRIRKYQIGNSRTLSKSKEITVLASPDHTPIPLGEKEKICIDLQTAVFLGDNSPMIKDALKEYCSGK